MLVVAIVLWMILNPGPEHIGDTNGSDNYIIAGESADFRFIAPAEW